MPTRGFSSGDVTFNELPPPPRSFMMSTEPSPTVRAKFRCHSVEQSTDAPVEVQRYYRSGEEPSTYLTWPRTFRFMAMYDPDVPEDQRYAQATPSGSLQMQVDNPAVAFEPGTDYYLDFIPVAP